MTKPNTQSKKIPQAQQFAGAPATATATARIPIPIPQHQRTVSAYFETYAMNLLLENRQLKAQLLARDLRIVSLENAVLNLSEIERKRRFLTSLERQQNAPVVAQTPDAPRNQQQELGTATQDVPTQQEEEPFQELPTAKVDDTDEKQHSEPGAGDVDTTGDDVSTSSEKKQSAGDDDEVQEKPVSSSKKRKRGKATKKEKGLSIRDRNWNKRFDELIAYKEKCGHCHVSVTGEYRALGMWTDVQRYNHKHMMTTGVAKGGMCDPEKIRRLLSVGFSFTRQRQPGNNQYPFEERFRQLAEFKAKMGHCNVSIPQSSHEDDEWPIGLGHFVADQRKYYNWIQAGVIRKNNPMNQDRIDQLNSIGFHWSLRKDWSLRKEKKQQDVQCLQDEEEAVEMCL